MKAASFYPKLAELNDRYYNAKDEDKESVLFAIEDLLKNQLKLEPKNTELWLRLVMLEYTPPLEYFDNINFYIQNILSYDPDNIDAAITLAYMHLVLYKGEVPDYLFNKLRRIHSDNAEKAAMLEIARAWAYQTRDMDTAYVKCLEKSIELDPSFASHYLKLGKHYMGCEQLELGAYFLKYGLKNVKLIYPDNYIYDVTDTEEFFNAHLRETHMTSILHYDYLDLIDRGPKVWEDFRNL